MPRMAVTVTGAMALGRMCLKSTLAVETPESLAAAINSRSLKVMVSALTSLATPIQLVSPMTTMMLVRLGSRKATTARIRKKDGKQSMTSTKRMMSSSQSPLK